MKEALSLKFRYLSDKFPSSPAALQTVKVDVVIFVGDPMLVHGRVGSRGQEGVGEIDLAVAIHVPVRGVLTLGPDGLDDIINGSGRREDGKFAGDGDRRRRRG